MQQLTTIVELLVPLLFGIASIIGAIAVMRFNVAFDLNQYLSERRKRKRDILSAKMYNLCLHGPVFLSSQGYTCIRCQNSFANEEAYGFIRERQTKHFESLSKKERQQRMRKLKKCMEQYSRL